MDWTKIAGALLIFLVLPMASLAQALPSHDRVHSEVQKTPAGELILIQSFTLDAPAEEVWEFFSKEDKFSMWVAPLVEIDMKINGTIRLNHNPAGSLDDDNTVTNHILNYVPGKLITLRPVIPDYFPDYMQQNEENFYSITLFRPTDDGQTEVTLYGMGYPDQEKYHEMIAFFAEGNAIAFSKLISILETD